MAFSFDSSRTHLLYTRKSESLKATDFVVVAAAAVVVVVVWWNCDRI